MEQTSTILKIREIYKLLFRTPKIQLSLKIDKTKDNDPFYKKITQNFYQLVTRRHKKMPVFGQMTRGVAICKLPGTYQDYIELIENSGHRNVKKAIRLGYVFQRINYNDYLSDILDIRKSTSVRQGKVSDSFMNTKPKAIEDPMSKNHYHDYPYFGVLDNTGQLVAYAGCFLAGEVIELSHFYGHAVHQKNGVIPLLVTSIAKYVIENHSQVKVFMYGGYIGSSATLRRFKKKFHFFPYHVRWSLK
jgi:hypothetical protein